MGDLVRSVVVGGFAGMLAATPMWGQEKPAEAGQPTYRLSVETKLVVVDVMVKDKHGNAVPSLKQSDFTLMENGRPQAIKNFEEHTVLSAADAAKVPSMPVLPPGEFTDLIRTPPNAALNILLIDRLNTQRSDQPYLIQQLIEYAKQAQPDARTAVFGLTDRLIELQSFTSDPTILKKALEAASKPKAASGREAVPGGSNSGQLTVDNRMLDEIKSVSPGTAAKIEQFEREEVSQLNQDRAKSTMDALNELGRALVAIPGRKNLIWFAGNFPPEILPGNNDVKVPYGDIPGLQDEFRETVNLLTRARVAVFPVDAQGLRASSFNSASQANPQYARQQSPAEARNGTQFGQDLDAENDKRIAEHLAMDQMASETGGVAIYNDNDLSKATHDAIAQGSAFYTLTYAPDAAAAGSFARDGYRSIAVQTGIKGYKLSYRRGYYLEKGKGVSSALQNDAVTPADQGRHAALQRALRHGGPTPAEILFRLHVAAVNGVEDKEPAQGNQLNPDEKKSHGPYRKYQVNYAASLYGMGFTQGDDKLYHADLDFAIEVYDNDGVLVNAQSNTKHASMDGKQMQAAMKTGLLFDQRISVPVRGDHSMRIVVYDHGTGRMGGIELSAESLAGLPPLPAVAAGKLAP